MRLRSDCTSASHPPTSIVAAPTTDTVPIQTPVPPRAGLSRASRYTPALTIVAEWRYALTGVGASIAFGSQKWNGTWADLVNAARRIDPAMAPYSGLAMMDGLCAAIADR